MGNEKTIAEKMMSAKTEKEVRDASTRFEHVGNVWLYGFSDGGALTAEIPRTKLTKREEKACREVFADMARWTREDKPTKARPSVRRHKPLPDVQIDDRPLPQRQRDMKERQHCAKKGYEQVWHLGGF